MGRPFGLWVKLHVGHARQSGFDAANVLLEYFWRDLCLDTVLLGHIVCGPLLFLLS
jgi:hypothetical protein